MKKIFFFISLLLTLSLYSCKKTNISDISYNSDKKIYTCKYKDISRSFILCLPEKYNNNTSIILMLHGLGESADSFKSKTQMEKEANLRNYAVVYVDGSVDPENKSYGKGWHFYKNDYSKNDEIFLIELVQYLHDKYNLGPKAFAVGFSNGGFMVNKLASSNYNKTNKNNFFTGVASVSGMMPKIVWDQKKSNGPIGYLQINGTKDDVVPMEFMGTDKNTQNPSMEKIIDYYSKRNHIPSDYKETPLSEKTTLRDYNSKVKWIIIQDGRHNWPEYNFSKINTTTVILDFFDSL